MFVALALIHDPEVVFLDELTTGLDPQARRAIWELIPGIRGRGNTVFLTTHLMEEAERLCDRVGIIEHGRLIEIGTPGELVEALSRTARGVHQRCTGVAEQMGAYRRAVGVQQRLHAHPPWRGRRLHDRCHPLDRPRTNPRDGVPHRDPDARRRVPEAHRPRHQGLTDATRFLRGFWKLTWVETKIFAREPMGLVGSLAVPAVMFVILGKTLGFGPPIAASAKAPPFNVAILAALMIAIGAVQSLVAIISIYREGGILKRLRATPLSPVTILGAHVAVKLGFTVVSLALVILAGRRVFPGVMQVNLLSFTAALFLGTPQHFLPGLHHRQCRANRPVRAAHRRGGALPDAPRLRAVLSRRRLPRLLQVIAYALPTTHAVSLMQGVWDGSGLTAHWLNAVALVVIFAALSALSTGSSGGSDRAMTRRCLYR